MSKVTERLDSIETAIEAEKVKGRLKDMGDTAMFEVIKDQLAEVISNQEELVERLDVDDLVYDVRDETIDIQKEYIQYLQGCLDDAEKTVRKLIKKNKKLKKDKKHLRLLLAEGEEE